jgi:protein SCO1
MRRTGRLLDVVFLLLLLVSLAGCSRPYRFIGTPYDAPQPAAEISGVNWDNTPFRLSEQRGRVALVFFGYTFCPDVCPTTLGEMRVMAEALGDKAKDVAVVFVSVDPERDTPEQLARYVPVFSSSFYGIHIPPDQLEPIKKAYGVIAEKRYYDANDSAAGYSVDHTARVFVVDKAGNLRMSFSYGTPADDMRSDVEHLLKE